MYDQHFPDFPPAIAKQPPAECLLDEVRHQPLHTVVPTYSMVLVHPQSGRTAFHRTPYAIPHTVPHTPTYLGPEPQLTANIHPSPTSNCLTTLPAYLPQEATASE